MTIAITLHHPAEMKSECGLGAAYETTWLRVADSNGNRVSIFMDARLADAIEEAFEDHENWLSSQEGPTFDEALGAKCDAEARVDEARRLKGMS